MSREAVCMEKLTFKRQLFLGIVLIIAGNILAFIFRKGIFSNIAWILYGLLFIINPVYPERYRDSGKKAKVAVRVVGIICVVVGLITRFTL